MADYEYDSNYATWLATSGATGYPTPVSIRGVLKYLCAQVGLVGGGTKAAQVGNGTTAGAHLWSGAGAPAFVATTGDIYFRTDGNAATAIYICTSGATPTWVAVT
jgi:hypothetical protein